MRPKPFLIVASICVAFTLAVILVVFGVTSSLVRAADGFLAHLESGDYEAAYACLSGEFHGNTTVDELRAFAQESALAEHADATWGDRSIYGDTGHLVGAVETKDGEYVPVEITLLKEEGTWKIYQIDW